MQGDRPTGERRDTVVAFFGAPAPFATRSLRARPGRGRAGGGRVLRHGRRPSLPHHRRAAHLGEVRRGARRAGGRWSPPSSARCARIPTQWFNFFDMWSPPPCPPRERVAVVARPAWPRPSARISTRSGPRCSPAPAGSRPSSAFPVADLRVGRGGEIKKLTRVTRWTGVPDCRATRLLVSAADELTAQVPLRSARRGSRAAGGGGGHRAGRRGGRRARARRRGPATTAARRPLRRARTQPGPLARRPRARPHRLHRLRVGRHRARASAPTSCARTWPTSWSRAATTSSAAS